MPVDIGVCVGRGATVGPASPAVAPPQPSASAVAASGSSNSKETYAAVRLLIDIPSSP